MASEKPPHILEPADPSSGRPATFIFVHGYGDDAEGLPLALAQQFQWYNKAEYVRWVLPNAPISHDAGQRSWYTPKALPNSLKPRVPGHEEDDDQEPDDEEGILRSCGAIDSLVQAELDRGVEPGRIIVGGFSQGCAVSLVWGLVGANRDKVGGVFCASGYFPLGKRIAELRKERGIAEGKDAAGVKKWLYVHGSKDMLVPTRLFNQGKEELLKWIDEGDMEGRLYEGMGHATCNAELKHLLFFMGRTIPA